MNAWNVTTRSMTMVMYASQSGWNGENECDHKRSRGVRIHQCFISGNPSRPFPFNPYYHSLLHVLKDTYSLTINLKHVVGLF